LKFTYPIDMFVLPMEMHRYTGQVGFVIAGMKSCKEARVGDTFYHTKFPIRPLPGFKPAKPMIYAGIYPVDNEDLEKLNEALQKLTLNDSSVTAEKETSDALGSGFRCGFLGLLHMDVFVQRLEEEYNVSVIATSPTVPYKVIRKRTGSDEDKEEFIVTNPSQFPEHSMRCFEPIVNATLVFPSSYLGPIMELCQDRRGKQIDLSFLDSERVTLRYHLPLRYDCIPVKTSSRFALLSSWFSFGRCQLALFASQRNNLHFL